MLSDTRITRVLRRCVYIAALLITCASVSGAPAAELTVNAHVSTAPVTLRFTVRIEPNPNNRLACLSYDSVDGEIGSSCWQIDGDIHPRTSWLNRHIGRAGEYQASLVVVSIVNGKPVHTLARTTFIVTEPGVPYVR